MKTARKDFPKTELLAEVREIEGKTAEAKAASAARQTDSVRVAVHGQLAHCDRPHRRPQEESAASARRDGLDDATGQGPREKMA
eukprot:2773042-Pleurochrysis_carterae.AAC.1